MYSLQHTPADLCVANGLTLHEAFVRVMGLSERAYRFTRTGGQMHLLLTNPPPDAPDFFSYASSDVVARDEIKRQVLAHGLGEFRVVRDDDFASREVGQRVAAE